MAGAETHLTGMGWRGLVAVSIWAVAAMIAAGPSDARSRHRRHDQMQGYVVQKRPPIPYAYSYYPEEIDGGVSGNLSFNNQIRKFKDPLNANGGGG